MSDEKNENEAEIYEIQIIFYEINKQICKSEEVVHKIKYILQKDKESLYNVVNIFTETLKFRKFSENAAIHKLRLKIQLTEQKHLNL